jgi:Lon protease-like protein
MNRRELLRERVTPMRLACPVVILALLSVPDIVRVQSATRDTAPGAVLLPPAIPIFPLEDVMLFPNVSRPLHIFEPRYRAMVADALKGDRIIGMILLRPGYEADYEGRPPVYPIGCAGVITDVEELPDGRYLIVLSGLVKFRVTGEDQSRPYRLARVETMPEVLDGEEKAALHKQRPRLEMLAAAIAPGSGPPPDVPDEDLVNALAQYVKIEPIERQNLLEQKTALERSQALIGLLEKNLRAEAGRSNGVADRTRLLCAHPIVPTYKGTGSTDDAANFACKAQ